MKLVNEKNIAILLASYNAGSYLREQLESLLGQSSQDWVCYCQDDGSSDNTIEIINDYAIRYPDHFHLIDNGLTQQGCANNFMSLLNCVESKYYMFCDQDDVWLPDKVQVSFLAIQHLESKYPEFPILIHTDRTFVDEKLQVIQQSEWNPRNKTQDEINRKINMLHNPNIIAIYNICAGNTMFFNHKVKQRCFPFLNIRVHDSIVAMAVANVIKSEKAGIIFVFP